MKRLIGISQRLIENQDYVEIREGLALDWGKFFRENTDFIPLPLSYEIDFSNYLSDISGIILSGGNDLGSLNPHSLNHKRDAYEKQIITECCKRQIPLLGVCRGAQIIGQYFSGTLKTVVDHTTLHQIIFLNNDYEVNSYHCYGIRDLENTCEILATAYDGSIEAFKSKQYPIFAIMWHLEREEKLSYPSKIVWDLFVRAINQK